MHVKRRGFIGLAIAGAMRPADASSLVPTNLYKLDQELNAISRDPACQLTSVSVLAIRDGQLACRRQVGLRSATPLTLVDESTLYRIASVSKLMVALVVMMLAEEGLDLDQDISPHLGFSLRSPHFPGRAVTWRHLLTHTSGLRDDAGYSWPGEVHLSRVMVPKMWSPKTRPGAYFKYANLNYSILGTAMESLTGERFDRLMKRRLLDPLGMHGGFHPAEFSSYELANLATLYRKRTTDTEVWDPAGPWIAQVDDYSKQPPVRPPSPSKNATPYSPAGGLRASAAGLGNVMLMLMNGGRHGQRQLLKGATVQRMFAREWTYDGKGANGDSEKGLYHAWGLGNQQFPDRLVEDGSFAGVGHLGFAYGLHSVFVADLARRNGMIVLVGGVSTDPDALPGRYSAMPRFLEQILTALHRRAILGKED